VETATLAELATAARLLADYRQVGYLADSTASLWSLINMAAQDARSFVLSSGGERLFAKRETWTLSSGTSGYLLDGTNGTYGSDSPLDRLLEVHLAWSTTHNERIDLVDEATFERLRQLVWGESCPKGWLIREQTLYLAPTPTTATTIALVYVPRYTTLVATTNALVGPEGFARLVALNAAFQMRGMKDLPTAFLEKQIAQCQAAMEQAIRRVTAHDGPRVRDVNPEGYPGDYYGMDYLLRREILPRP